MLQLLIHMFHASLIPCISLDQYLNPNLYTIPNMQNMRFFCCSVYIRQRMQEPLYQTVDARDYIRQRMHESLYQTADARDYFRQRMQETLYQTADAGVSISDS